MPCTINYWHFAVRTFLLNSFSFLEHIPHIVSLNPESPSLQQLESQRLAGLDGGLDQSGWLATWLAWRGGCAAIH